MTITNRVSDESYSIESNPIFLEQGLVAILAESKLFPLTFDQLFSQISKKINTQKKKKVELTLHNLIQDDMIIILETNNGTAYFCKTNERLVHDKFICILQQFHRQYPHKSGITKSQIRTYFSKNKNKKKQKSICPFLLNYIINIAKDQQLIKSNEEILSLEGFIPQFDLIDLHLEILLELIRDNFEFKRSDKSEFAKEMNISLAELRNYLKILKQKELVFEIKENLLIDINNLQKVKKIVYDKILKDGPTHIKEFGELLNHSRSSILPFFDFLDKINFTKRIDDKRVLVNVETDSWVR